jgi:hypothetical protein
MIATTDHKAGGTGARTCLDNISREETTVFALFALQVPIDTLHITHISILENTQSAGQVQHSRVDKTFQVS